MQAWSDFLGERGVVEVVRLADAGDGDLKNNQGRGLGDDPARSGLRIRRKPSQPKERVDDGESKGGSSGSEIHRRLVRAATPRDYAWRMGFGKPREVCGLSVTNRHCLVKDQESLRAGERSRLPFHPTYGRRRIG